jgi:TRAP-type mannitol/chloroaromatic compound transport system permease small subunit
MHLVAALVRFAYGLNRIVAHAAAWLIFASVLICTFVAVARYLFGFGRIWTQELYVVAFGVSFMLIAAYAYAIDAHVRVDIVLKSLSERRRAMIEILGVLVFLMPWLFLVAWSSRAFVEMAWRVAEGSPQPGGLPGFYLVKTVIPIFCLLLFIQGLGKIGASMLILQGRRDLLPGEEQVRPADDAAHA